jgi:hypothetical protein
MCAHDESKYGPNQAKLQNFRQRGWIIKFKDFNKQTAFELRLHSIGARKGGNENLAAKILF